MTRAYKTRKKARMEELINAPLTAKEERRFIQLVNGKGMFKLAPHENNTIFKTRMERWYLKNQKEQQRKLENETLEKGSTDKAQPK